MCKTVIRSALPFFLFWHGIPVIVIVKPLSKQHILRLWLSIDWATGRRCQTKFLDTWTVAQIYLLRQDSVNCTKHPISPDVAVHCLNCTKHPISPDVAVHCLNSSHQARVEARCFIALTVPNILSHQMLRYIALIPLNRHLS